MFLHLGGVLPLGVWLGNEKYILEKLTKFHSNSNYFGFQVSGLDKYFESTLKLLDEFMVEMHVREEDNNKLEKLVENSKIVQNTKIVKIIKPILLLQQMVG